MKFNNLLPGMLPVLLLSGLALASPVQSGLARRNSTRTDGSRCGRGRQGGGRHSNNGTIIPPEGACGANSATNRGCWKDTWNINTDYERTIPPGTTRNYDLHITNVSSFGPDGVERMALLINGIYPGPTLVADWGDYLNINVHNEMTDNGTVFHWHGFRQVGSGTQDGVNGVTECPIPPGASRLYTFRATQYGTSWYHSHFSVQYGDGLVGTIQINGPASANYDVDLGTYPVTDWYHDTINREYLKSEQATGGPPKSGNVLFNGTNVQVNGTGGAYSRVTLTPGKKHRLRIINTSVENHFTLSLAKHNFTVIATDFVPVRPVVKNSLFIAVGQRYDIIIDATQAVDNYWFNATLATSGLCGLSENPFPAAIFSYEGASAGSLPTSPGAPVDAGCKDATDFQPIVARTARQDDFLAHQQELAVNLTTTVTNRGKVFKWTVNGSVADTEWDKPILQYVLEGNRSYPRSSNVVELDSAGVWTFWVIDNLPGALPHPIHLHGHDFLVLGSGDSGTFDAATDTAGLNFANPTRRDVTMLPGGWLVVAFQTDNPGAWLLHCHIAWHVSQGLSVQFLELMSQIPQAFNLEAIQPNCAAWREYQPVMPYQKIDSGL